MKTPQHLARLPDIGPNHCFSTKMVAPLLLCVLSCFTGGCALSPTPVVLLEKPAVQTASTAKKGEVFLVVRDNRSEAVKKAHICGTKRNSYMMPTSFAFLAHPEPLDAILATHLKRVLEKAGFDVVGAEPSAPERLQSETLKKPPVESAEASSAMKANAQERADKTQTQGATVEEAQAAGQLQTNPQQMPRGPSAAVVDVAVESFNSDTLQEIVSVSVQGWCKFDVAVCKDSRDAGAITWAKSIRGIGTSGPRPVITSECYSTALNMAYWVALQQLEGLFKSPEFAQAVTKAGAAQSGRRESTHVTPSN